MTRPISAQQAYAATPSANAVSINIYNPTAYGSAPNSDNSVPYNYTNSFYNVPRTSVYDTNGQQVQYPQTQYTAYAQNPYSTNAPAYTTSVAAPAPEVMPQSVLTVQNAPVQPQTEQQPVVSQAPEAQQATETKTVEEPKTVDDVQVVTPTINTDELVQGLKSTDADERAKAINEIAAHAQEAPEVSMQMLTEPIINSLVDIIKEDTTNLEGPSEEQVKLLDKSAKGETLTDAENATLEQLSPRDKANKNRIFALYTLAMIQKLQRDELDQYIENQKASGEQPIEPLKLQDLTGYNEMADIIKNDQRPEVQMAAIQALQHVAKPEEKAEVESVLSDALKSDNESIKQAAEETMMKLAA